MHDSRIACLSSKPEITVMLNGRAVEQALMRRSTCWTTGMTDAERSFDQFDRLT